MENPKIKKLDWVIFAIILLAFLALAWDLLMQPWFEFH